MADKNDNFLNLQLQPLFQFKPNQMKLDNTLPSWRVAFDEGEGGGISVEAADPVQLLNGSISSTINYPQASFFSGQSVIGTKES